MTIMETHGQTQEKEAMTKKVADLETRLAAMRTAEKSGGQYSAAPAQYRAVDETVAHARPPAYEGSGDLAVVKALTQLYAVGTAYFNAMKGAMTALKSLYGGQELEPAYATANMASAGYKAKGE